jgi:hypothetical protein
MDNKNKDAIEILKLYILIENQVLWIIYRYGKEQANENM